MTIRPIFPQINEQTPNADQSFTEIGNQKSTTPQKTPFYSNANTNLQSPKDEIYKQLNKFKVRKTFSTNKRKKSSTQEKTSLFAEQASENNGGVGTSPSISGYDPYKENHLSNQKTHFSNLLRSKAHKTNSGRWSQMEQNNNQNSSSLNSHLTTRQLSTGYDVMIHRGKKEREYILRMIEDAVANCKTDEQQEGANNVFYISKKPKKHHKSQLQSYVNKNALSNSTERQVSLTPICENYIRKQILNASNVHSVGRNHNQSILSENNTNNTNQGNNHQHGTFYQQQQPIHTPLYNNSTTANAIISSRTFTPYQVNQNERQIRKRARLESLFVPQIQQNQTADGRIRDDELIQIKNMDLQDLSKDEELQVNKLKEFRRKFVQFNAQNNRNENQNQNNKRQNKRQLQVKNGQSFEEQVQKPRQVNISIKINMNVNSMNEDDPFLD